MRYLAPWDGAPHFQSVAEQAFQPTQTDWMQLAPADPQRVCLIIQNTTTVGIKATVTPDAAFANGLFTVRTSPPIVITYATHGNLVQMAWFGVAMGVGNSLSTVIQIRLKDWPAAERL